METPKKKTASFSYQILPANQVFYAVFVNDDGEMLSKPVICWAAKETAEGKPEVHGMIDGEDGICLCDDDTYSNYWFVGYTGPGENPTDLSMLAMEIARASLDEYDDDSEDDLDDELDDDLDFDALDSLNFPPQNLMKNLPVVLSQISVLVREQFEHEDVPDEWKEWLGFMKKFSRLTEDERNDKKTS